MSNVDVAKDKAARLLKKRASISSAASSEFARQKKHGSMSTISFLEDGGTEGHNRPVVRMENTYQLTPPKKFPSHQVQSIIRDVLEGYLSEEKYEPELCRQMTKTISEVFEYCLPNTTVIKSTDDRIYETSDRIYEVVRARVKEMMVVRYKIIAIVHIGQLNDQGMRMGSRCLWDQGQDTFASYEFRNNSLFAVGTVYGVYAE